jgi:hypothetical protein
MAHAQKPDFVFRRNGRVHLNRRGRQVSRLLAAEVCASAVVMLDTPCFEVVWRVLANPLHSPVSLSLPLPCVTVCHHISAVVSRAIYKILFKILITFRSNSFTWLGLSDIHLAYNAPGPNNTDSSKGHIRCVYCSSQQQWRFMVSQRISAMAVAKSLFKLPVQIPRPLAKSLVWGLP